MSNPDEKRNTRDYDDDGSEGAWPFLLTVLAGISIFLVLSYASGGNALCELISGPTVTCNPAKYHREMERQPLPAPPAGKED